MRIWIASIVTLLLVAASPQSVTASPDIDQSASPSGLVVPIFAERPIRVQRPRDLYAGRLTAVDKAVKVNSFGTGFLYSNPGFNALVTAAHVVAFPPNLESVADADGVYAAADGYRLDVGAPRIRIGGLALQPVRLLVDHSLDIAVLELDDESAELLSLQVLRPGQARVDSEAKIWGFPGIPGVAVDGVPQASTPSASQTSQRCDITDLRKGEVICTALNGIETRGGFSGGPLINSKGEVIGMISRSTPETTRCRSIEAINSVLARFPTEASLYQE